MKIFPVVHIKPNDLFLSVRQGKMALEHGADGVFLINHYGGVEEVFHAMRFIRSGFKDRDCFIGINLLEYSTEYALRFIISQYQITRDESNVPQALWVDDVLASGENWTPQEAYRNKQKSDITSQVQLFGGIAHKASSTYASDPDEAAKEVEQYRNCVDVVTTSGSGTGFAPTVEKLCAVKATAEDKPVAVASGITAENLPSFAFVDYILVSSSIETTPGSGEFDEDRLSEMIKIVHDINLNN